MPAMNPSFSSTGGEAAAPAYITTPIYYVNDRPHIGHCYTTCVADAAARALRLIGRDVFFLTGTDEHADKVSKSAAEHGVTPLEWADRNAQRFREAFAFMGFSNDDFVRTTQDRHKRRAQAYIQRLVDSGDISLGDYEGWYDPSQEEYVTESTAKEHDFKSPVTGRPLEKRVEQNYFFDLTKYEAWLKDAIERDVVRVLPEARKNEVLGRIRQGLNRVPVSRRFKEGDVDWGIPMPNDPGHRIYVWIEALCNYLTVVDNGQEPSTVAAEGARRKYWRRAAGGSESRSTKDGGGSESRPTQERSDVVHVMAKDILWFHAVIWPAMLHALGETPPAMVYAHSYFVAEGRKMSKSLGNFIEIDQLRAYADRYSLDAVRWYLLTQGPLGEADADFAYKRFVEVYNADLANGIGNATSRVGNMIEKYFGGVMPDVRERAMTRLVRVDGTPVGPEWPALCAASVAEATREVGRMGVDRALRLGIDLAAQTDQFIADTAPFKLAKALDGPAVYAGLGNAEALGVMLYQSAEALRVASLLLAPAMPFKMAELWRRWNCNHLRNSADAESGFAAPLAELARFGGPFGLKPGQAIAKGDPLFMRADGAEPAPDAAAARA